MVFENGGYSPTRLKVGDKTRIAKKDLTKDINIDAEIGKDYINQPAFDPPLLIPNDGDKNNSCTVRVEEIDGGECICVVTDVYRDER